MAETLTVTPFRMLADMRDCREIAIRCWDHAVADRLLDQISEGFYLVARIDGRPVGFTGARQSYLAPNTWEIPWIAVDPAHHGKHIGSELLAQLIHELTYIRRAHLIFTVTKRTSFFASCVHDLKRFEVVQSYEDGWCLMSLQAGPVVGI
jgi:GNAT superfamily N-acetyltransferase